MSFTETPEIQEEELSFYQRIKQSKKESIEPSFYESIKQSKQEDKESISFYQNIKQDSEGLFSRADRKIKGILDPIEKGIEKFRQEKLLPKKPDKPIESILDPYRPEQKTPEEIRAMSPEERGKFVKESNYYQEILRSGSFTKGYIAGRSFNASEFSEKFRYNPDEEDPANYYLGKTIGFLQSAKKLKGAVTAPLIKLSLKSPVAAQKLVALSGIIGSGIVGVTQEGISEAAHGEPLSVKDIAKEGAIWVALETVFTGLGALNQVRLSLNKIAKDSGIPTIKVLSKFLKSVGKKIIGKSPKAKDINPKFAKEMLKTVKQAEKEGLEKAIEVKVEPIKEEFPIEKPKISQEIEILPKDLARQPTEKPSKVLKPIEPTKGITKPIKLDIEQAKDQKTQTPSMAERKPIQGTKQAARRSDIIKIFRDAFNDPIRLGKLGKRNVLGIHKGWPKVSRLLKDNDIETAAHEIGHNLHFTLYGGESKTPQELRNNTIKNLNPFMPELKKLAASKPYTLEGFAEFTRLYVTNPEVAQDLAPKFYQKFENDLDVNYPELKNSLIEARDYYDNYIKGTPESRIDAQLRFVQDESRLNNFVNWIKSGFDPDNLKTQFLDDIFPAKRLVSNSFGIPLSAVEDLKDPRNLYRSLRLLKGSIGKGDVFLKFETFDPITLDRTGEGLRQILNELPDENSYREFNRFLIARRSIEKFKQEIDTGIQEGDALFVHDELKEKYGDLAKRLDKYNDSLLRYTLKSGLISKNQYNQIKAKNLYYAPFQRVMEDRKQKGISSTGRIQTAKPIKRMKGSTRDIIAPIESVIKNTYNIIVASEKNRVGQVLAKISEMQNVGMWIERVPTPIHLKAKISKEEVIEQIKKRIVKQKTGFSKYLEAFSLELSDILPDFFLRFGSGNYPAGENIITVFFNGKPRYFEASPEIYEMWTKGTTPYTSNLLVKILKQPAKLLRAGAILNPKFIQKNFIRDTWGGWIFSKYGKSIKNPIDLFMDTIYQPLSMLAQAAKQGSLYVEWMKSGGGLSTMQSIDRDKVLSQIAQVKKDFKPYQLIKILRKTAEISEEGNRLAEFGRALQVEGKTRLGREISAFASRDLSIDFAKMGLQVKAINQIIPFFNATLQGGDKLLRTLANPKARKAFLPKVIQYIVIPSLILAWLNKDDEDIKELQDQEKDFNFIFKIGNTIYKIPVTFETGVISHGLTQRMVDYFINKNPEAFEGFMGSIGSAALPNFIPTFALPFIESAANKNFFTGARIVPLPQEKLTSKYQFKTYTSTTSRLLGRVVGYMVGEDTRSKAASPAIIDHFINSWGGGLGRLMLTISDASLEVAGLGDKIPKPEQRITEKLGLEAFIARYPRSNTKSIEKFYDFYQDATAREKSQKYSEKFEIGTEEEGEKAYERIDHLYNLNDLRIGYEAIQSCQKEINMIMIDPAVTSQEKLELIDELYLQMIDFARESVKDTLQHRLEQKKEKKKRS